MRQIIAIAALLLGVAVAAAADAVRDPLPSATEPGYVSASDAVSDVRDLADDPSLPVTVVKYPPADHSLSQIGLHYVLTAGGYTYHVGYRYKTISRHVITTSTGKPASPVSGEQLAQVQPEDLDQDDAQNVAYQYMADNFPVPAQDMVLMDSETGQGPDQTSLQYRFIYHQAAADGFIGPADCDISVDSASGGVTDCILNDFPLLVDGAPLLNAGQAIADAAQAIDYVPDGTPAVTLSWIGPPDDLGNEEQGYNVSLPGYAYGYTTDWENWYVTLDANTGAILLEDVEAAMRPKGSVDLTAAQVAAVQRETALPFPKPVGRQIGMTMFGRKGFLDRPGLLIETDPYIYLNYVLGAASASATNGPNGEVIVQSAIGIVAFRFDVGSHTVDGRSRQLAHLPIFTAGAYYIPLELAAVIAPGRFVYSAKSRTVDYRPANSAKLTAMAM